MARFSYGATTSAAITATRPAMGVANTAAGTAQIRECGVSNNAAVNVDVMMALMTAIGTIETITEYQHRAESFPNVCQAGRFTADPTVGATCGFRQMLGAAIGAGVIWTFGGDGLGAPKAATAGVCGGALGTGAGQVVDCYMVWDE